MGNTEELKKQIVEALKEILKTSHPHCKDGNPNESDFIRINQLAYDSLRRIEQLRV